MTGGELWTKIGGIEQKVFIAKPFGILVDMPYIHLNLLIFN